MGVSGGGADRKPIRSQLYETQVSYHLFRLEHLIHL